MIWIILLYALFGTTFTLGKVIVNYAPALFLVGIRMTIAGAVLMAYQYFFSRDTFRIDQHHWKYYIQIILFTIFIPYTLRFWALNYMSSSKTSLLYNFGPFVSYLFSHFLLGERFTFKKVLGLFIGFVGIMTVLYTGTPTEDMLGTFMHISWPEIGILASVTSFSYGWIVMRKLVKHKEYSPVMINGIGMLGGGLLSLILAFIFEKPPYVTDVKTFASILSVIILVSNFICYNLYGALLKRYSATMLSFAGFLGPLFTALYGSLFLGEVITWRFFLSSSIIILGLIVFYQEEWNENYYTN